MPSRSSLTRHGFCVELKADKRFFMKNELVLGKVKIVRTPDGEAPVRVREEWVGVILPVIGMSASSGKGVISGKDTDDEPAYVVSQADAIAALEQKSRKAAGWWKDNGYPQNGGCFGFKVAQCKVVGKLAKPPRRQYVGILEVGVGAHDSWENVQPQ